MDQAEAQTTLNQKVAALTKEQDYGAIATRAKALDVASRLIGNSITNARQWVTEAKTLEAYLNGADAPGGPGANVGPGGKSSDA